MTERLSIERIEQYLTAPRPLPIATATVCMQQLADTIRENDFLKSQLEAATEEEMRLMRYNERLRAAMNSVLLELSNNAYFTAYDLIDKALSYKDSDNGQSS